MPVTFGSVGDIISVSLIVKDLVKALDDSRGSAAEYQEVIRELWMLDRVLLQVELLSRTCDQSVDLNALCVTARRIVDSCRQCMKVLLDKIEKYRTSLRSQNEGNPIRDIAMKIRWHLSRSGELAKFRAEINTHCISLDMLPTTANLNITRLNDAEARQRHLMSEERIQETAEEQNSLLVDIRSRITKNTQLVKSYAENVGSALRLDWLKTLGSELKNFMGRILVTNLAIYRAVLDIRASLPSHLERALIYEPFLLEDAIGRISPIHMQFISSWDAFDSVLAIRFRDMQGHAKVLSKEYILQEHATRRDISRNHPWEATFLPGQRIDMSMIFQRVGQPSQASCPGCQQVCGISSAEETQCAGCGLLFKRVTEINDQKTRQKPSEIPASPGVPNPIDSLETQPEHVKTSGGISRGQKWPHDDSVSVENEVMHFKRVRLIYQQTTYCGILETPFDGDTSTKAERKSSFVFFRELLDFDTYTELQAVTQAASKNGSKDFSTTCSFGLEDPYPQTVTLADLQYYHIPVDYFHTLWHPDRVPIILSGNVFDSVSFMNWICSWTVYIFRHDSFQMSRVKRFGKQLINLGSAISDIELADDSVKRKLPRDLYAKCGELWAEVENIINGIMHDAELRLKRSTWGWKTARLEIQFARLLYREMIAGDKHYRPIEKFLKRTEEWCKEVRFHKDFVMLWKLWST